MESAGLTYRERDAILVQMGFVGYSAYLASPLWKSIRRRVLRGKPRCRRCSGTACQVHHTDYSRATLAGQSLVALVPICRSCHEFIEFDADGRKRSLVSANAVLLKTRKPPSRKRKRQKQANRQPNAVKDTPQHRRRNGAVLCEDCRLLRVSAKTTGVCDECQQRRESRRVKKPPGLWDLVPKPEPILGFAVATKRPSIWNPVCKACGGSRKKAQLDGLCRKCRRKQSGPGPANTQPSSCTDEPVRHTSGLDGRGAKTREIASTPAA